MTSFKNNHHYQRLISEDEQPPEHIGTRHDQTSSHWGIIKDLDDFFTQVYKYYTRQGFFCVLFEELSKLVQYVFIVFIALVLFVCVDFDFIRHYGDPVIINGTTVYQRYQGQSIFDAIDFSKLRNLKEGQVVGVGVFLLVAGIFYLGQFLYVAKRVWEAWRMRRFYHEILQIYDGDLMNKTWPQVVQMLVAKQDLVPLNVGEKRLTELDIVHRIMRRKNFRLALENKGVISHLYFFPLLGERTFLTLGMKFNLKLILFSDPFDTSWQLRDEYRNSSKRFELADRLSRKIFWIGIVNLILCPFILAYQLLHSFFSYADIIKRNPSSLGYRRWSQYARIRLRHFNELDHELKYRLDKGYKPAKDYMNCFPLQRIFIVMARNVGFFAGAMLAIIITANVMNEQLIFSDHMFVAITVLGITVTVCRAVIPDENLAFNPQGKLEKVANYVHYIPPSMTREAHTMKVNSLFTRLLQYKMVCYLEELLSPIVTPLLLIFCLRLKAMEIVEFYQKFTVTVLGVGDVCSFSMMDVKKHGNPMWKSDEFTEAEVGQQAENGKTEKSLVAFKAKHPKWKAPSASESFMTSIQRPGSPHVHFQSINPMATLASLPPVPEKVSLSQDSKCEDDLQSVELNALHPSALPPRRSLYPLAALQEMTDEFGNSVSVLDSSINQTIMAIHQHAEEQEEKIQTSQKRYEDSSLHFRYDTTSDESSV